MSKIIEAKVSAEQKTSLGEITKRYRAEACMSVAAFGKHLCEELEGVKQSRQNIYQWEKGKRAMPRNFLLKVALAYDAEDWRYMWAVDCLQVIDPETWGVSTPPPTLPPPPIGSPQIDGEHVNLGGGESGR